MYLIIKQAYDVGLYPAVPDAHLLRRAGAARVLEDPGREGHLRLVHRLLPPDHEAAGPRARPSARSTWSSSRRSPIYGAFNAYSQVVAAGRRASTPPRATRPRTWSRRCSTTSSRAGTARSASRAARARTGSSGRRPMLVTQYTKPEMPFTEVKIVYPPEFKTGDWMPAPSAEAARASVDAVLLSQYVLSGVVIGVIYSLMALGITFIYSIMKMINWAHGRVLHDRQLRAVRAHRQRGRAGPLVAGPAAGDGRRCSCSGLVIQRVLLRPMFVGGDRAARRVRDDHHHRADGLLPEPGHRAGRAEPVRAARLRAPGDARHAADLGQSLRGAGGDDRAARALLPGDQEDVDRARAARGGPEPGGHPDGRGRRAAPGHGGVRRGRGAGGGAPARCWPRTSSSTPRTARSRPSRASRSS